MAKEEQQKLNLEENEEEPVETTEDTGEGNQEEKDFSSEDFLDFSGGSGEGEGEESGEEEEEEEEEGEEKGEEEGEEDEEEEGKTGGEEEDDEDFLEDDESEEEEEGKESGEAWQDLAKDLGIRAESYEEFKEKVKEKDEKIDELQNQVGDSSNNQVINTLQQYKNLEDEDLVRASLEQEAKNKNWSEDKLERKIERVRERDEIEDEADKIRDGIDSKINEQVSAERERQKKDQEDREENNKEYINKLKKFLSDNDQVEGITFGKDKSEARESKREVYKSLKDGSFIEELRNDPEKAARLSFLDKNSHRLREDAKHQGKTEAKKELVYDKYGNAEQGKKGSRPSKTKRGDSSEEFNPDGFLQGL